MFFAKYNGTCRSSSNIYYIGQKKITQHVKCWSHVSWAEKKIPKIFISKVMHEFVNIPVSEYFSFAKIIHPPDRCGISESWWIKTAWPLHRCTLCWGQEKATLKMCSFVTQHNATDVLSYTDVNIVNRVPRGGGVMVWESISYGQWTQLLLLFIIYIFYPFFSPISWYPIGSYSLVPSLQLL
jgi:hypothetical protein